VVAAPDAPISVLTSDSPTKARRINGHTIATIWNLFICANVNVCMIVCIYICNWVNTLVYYVINTGEIIL
jgi:hypothetical protein